MHDAFDLPNPGSNFDDVGDFHTKFGLPSVTNDGAYPRHPKVDLVEMRLNFLMEELTEIVKGCGGRFVPEWDWTEVPLGGQATVIQGVKIVIDEAAQPDHAEIFDGLIDLTYVAMGTAHIMGYPWHAGWATVQQANMAKERATSAEQSKRGSAYDVVKPPGWQPPNIQGILEMFGWSQAKIDILVTPNDNLGPNEARYYENDEDNS